MRNFSGLVKRGGVYCVAVRVPADLRPVLGAPQIEAGSANKKRPRGSARRRHFVHAAPAWTEARGIELKSVRPLSLEELV